MGCCGAGEGVSGGRFAALGDGFVGKVEGVASLVG